MVLMLYVSRKRKIYKTQLKEINKKNKICNPQTGGINTPYI